ncbi:hypothetical protein D6779_02910 [Candidatus Parcubacteria bacterium]|nr:MAG: hypothetical protein D6779_02910 [Candidatus Parcubacteria bacterium]
MQKSQHGAISLGKLILIAIGSIAVVGGALLLFINFAPPSADQDTVVLEFSSPKTITVGQPFSVKVSFVNSGNFPLKDAKLALSIPQGIYFIGSDETQRVAEQALGDIGPGSADQRIFNLIALEGRQTLKRLEAVLSYRRAGSEARFEEKSQVDLTIGGEAVTMTLESPARVFSGEQFEIKLHYRNNTDSVFEDLTLTLAVPDAFSMDSADPKPSKENNWHIATLNPGEEGNIIIKGSLKGPEKAFFGFRAELLGNIGGTTYKLATKGGSVSIASSIISATITVNNKKDYIAHIDDDLDYVITLHNNSEITIENINVRATLLGKLYDYPQLSTDGFFNSLTNTITWNPAQNSSLFSLGPGESTALRFSIPLLSAFPVARLGDKNYTLKVRVEAESPTVPPQTTAEKTMTVTQLETKVAGKLAVDAQAFFRDAKSGIINEGDYPPQVNRTTQYTIHWKVYATATDVSNVLISAFLQSGAQWTGKVKSNINSVPQYDPHSGQVTWAISHVPANTGIVTKPIEAIFQISHTPSVVDVGKDVKILTKTRIEGRDDFTGIMLTNEDDILTTNLVDDPTVSNIRNPRVRP